MKAVLNTDGGARGNPGPAGIGVLLRSSDGKSLGELGRGIGSTTNNVAEYKALISGLELALAKDVTEIEVLTDSKLVVNQVTGRWKIKNDRLRRLAAQAESLMGKFDRATISYVPRAENQDADRLANVGMDEAEVAGDVGLPEQTFF
ncbi:MAG TPA: ribonuclease HI family protein [Actinomycetota bacterium]|jgi:ribonuclease HI|nr:ribonuclease HI family protein [Actinomycetota bacterium]